MQKSAEKRTPLEQSTTRTQEPQANPPAAHPLVRLQSDVGNQAVMHFLRNKAESSSVPALPIQSKLTVGQQSDPYEQEADRVAEQVTSMSEPQLELGCDSNEHLQMKSAGESGIAQTEAPPIVSEVLHSSGQPLDSSTREFFEPRFGRDFSNIRIHDDNKAASSANALSARAYTIGQHVVFGEDQFNPQDGDGRNLLAHELAHTLQQGHMDAGLMVQREPAPERTSFPWLGKIENTWTASLRSAPTKAADDPHGNTLVDLPKGTDVTVIGHKGGWMHVQVEIDGRALTGYVSTELITYVSPSAFVVPEIVLEMKFPSVAEAFVELKRAEKKKAKEGAAFKPTEEEESRINMAIIVLKGTKKYVVDENSFAVDFVAQSGPVRTKITTIEDFILFVEQVEKQYPSATPQEVASEVRQMWFSDENWEILVASRGISDKGKEVDIETQPNPIASRFDMDQIAPRKGSLQLDTRLGKVDIGHVMAGIDAKISGFAYGADSNKLKYETLKTASGGDTLDFATWAGDLGQAYAEYLADRYVNENASASLKTFTEDKAPADEVLGDIHGYVAVEVYKAVPASESPTGNEVKISNILRDMYLVTKSTSAGTSQKYLERVAGKSNSDLKPFITERTLRFARPWFAKKAIEKRGWWDSEGWTEAGILENTLEEFDKIHSNNEKTATPDNKLETLVDSFLQRLSAPIK